MTTFFGVARDGEQLLCKALTFYCFSATIPPLNRLDYPSEMERAGGQNPPHLSAQCANAAHGGRLLIGGSAERKAGTTLVLRP